MSEHHTENERQRLAQLYSSLSDEELEMIAADFANLTDEARFTLLAETDRRDMEIEFDDAAPEQTMELGPPLVTVARFRDLAEAMLAKTYLDSAAIPTFLADENLVRMDWLYSNLIGGIKLQVREQDADAATTLLASPEPALSDDDTDLPRCPRCQSDEVAFQRFNKTATFGAWLLLGFPVPVPRNAWHCQACGADWQDK